MKKPITALLACTLFSLAGCTGAEGPPGPRGAAGAPGPKGEQGEPGKDADSIDGSRLAARYIIGDDGSRQPLGDWLDVETDMPCRFKQESGADLRCVPDDFGGGIFVHNADAECKTLVAWTKSPNLLPLPEYGRYSANPTTYVHVGSPVVAVEGLWQESAGACIPVEIEMQGGQFFAADPLSLDFFVSGAVE